MEGVDTAYPGDVVGLVNAAALRVGDTLYDGRRLCFPPMPTFTPEHLAVGHRPLEAIQAWHSPVRPSRCCAGPGARGAR